MRSGTTPEVAEAGSLYSVEAYKAAILAVIAPLAPTSLALAAAEGGVPC